MVMLHLSHFVSMKFEHERYFLSICFGQVVKYQGINLQANTKVGFQYRQRLSRS